MEPKIYYRDVKFRLGKTRHIKKWILQVIRSEGKRTDDLNFFIVSDKIILDINREFLRHDYNTDVIAFNYGEGEIIKGEIYISIDTVRLNAQKYGVLIMEEVLRVMIHGVLHLCGYGDRDHGERNIMKEKEDYYLERIRKGDGV